MNILICFLLTCTALWSAEFKAGVSRLNITPTPPVWLSGYAARNHPAETVLQELWAKALALEDDRGTRLVIITTDLIGLPAEVSATAATQLKKRFGLDRAQVLFNSSHTHSGPAVGSNLSVMFDFNAEDKQRCLDYTKSLTVKLAEVAGAALRDLSLARLATGHGTADFAINRRQSTPQGTRIGLNPQGPVDHDVPVLKVTTPEGQLRVLLFGYACHNTTLDIYQVNGDYAGFAQTALENTHPGVTAMFLELCAGDQNPSPRRTIELAEQHGNSLATAVNRVLENELRPVRPPIVTAYTRIQLDFAPHDRQTFEKEAASTNRFLQRRAKLMLETYDQGQPMRQMPYPIQVVRLNQDLTLVALGGEVVVDYALRLKREYPRENLIVVGYCNEVRSYIPSQRVLKEGGYEPVDSMIYYGQPGPFQENVEETIFVSIHQLMTRCGATAR